MTFQLNFFRFLRYSLIFLTVLFFSQNEIYKSEIPFENDKNEPVTGSILLINDKMVFNAGNYTLYCLDKNNHNQIWERKIGLNSNLPPYKYGSSFFYGNYDGDSRKVHQYDLNTGKTIKTLSVQSVISQPYFKNAVMYATVLSDGGKLIAYDLQQNKVLWNKNIGHGVDFQPVFHQDKMIVKAEDDYWIQIDYDGNFINSKSDIHTFIDDEKVAAKKYEFLTQDGKEVTKEFLKKNRLENEDFKLNLSQNYAFILTEGYLTVVGKNLKKKLQLDLETIIPPEEYEDDALSKIIMTDKDQLWFIHQNHLIHYDAKKEKVLRNVYLNNWRPHQLLVDGRNIWLISKNDGQLYHLDFEPDEDLDRKIKLEKAIQDRLRCDPPNPEKMKAAKAAEEKLTK